MLIRHSLYYFLGRGLPGLIGFVAIALFTRLLTAEEFGRYALILAVVGLFNVVFFQWIRLVIGRFLPNAPPEQDFFLGEIGAICLALIGGILVIGFPLIYFLFGSLEPFIVGLAFALLIATAGFEIVLSVSRAQLHPGRFGALMVAKSVIFIIVGATLAWKGFGAISPIWGLIFGSIIALLILRRDVLRRMKPRLPTSVNLARYLGYGLPLTAAFALQWIINGSDRLILSWLLNDAAAGLYSAGYDLSFQSLTLTLVIVNTAAYPLAVKALEQNGPEAARIQLRVIGEATLALALAGAACLILLGPQIIVLVLGTEFQDSASSIFALVAMASALAGIKAYYFDFAFQLGHATKWQILSAGVAAVVNILLNLLLIPNFGIVGAAWATLIAYAVSLVISAVTGRACFEAMPALAPILGKAVPVALCTSGGAYIGLMASDVTQWALLIGLLGAGVGFAVMAYMVDLSGCRIGRGI